MEGCKLRFIYKYIIWDTQIRDDERNSFDLPIKRENWGKGKGKWNVLEPKSNTDNIAIWTNNMGANAVHYKTVFLWRHDHQPFQQKGIYVTCDLRYSVSAHALLFI